MTRQRIALALLLSVIGIRPSFATAQESRTIRHVVVSVAATNDEWTTTGLAVGTEDLIVISVPGAIRVGPTVGQVDATGANPNSPRSTGYGVLEFKIGVGAGKSAGKFSLHRSDSRGELKFRVKDTRYDDNAGAFEVDVVVIPQAALPAATRVGEPAPQDLTTDFAKSEMAAMTSFLTNLRTAEETFFTDSNRYTNRIAALRTISLPPTMTIKSLMVGANGNSWAGIVTSPRLPGVECGMAVAVLNPVDASVGEGEPVCRNK